MEKATAYLNVNNGQLSQKPSQTSANSKSTTPCGMRLEWVRAIHHKLHLRYGEAWVAQSDAFTTEEIEVDWAEVLSGITGEQVKWGLDTWSGDFPPNVTQFKNKCLKMGEADKPMNASHKVLDPARTLEAKRASRGVVEQEMAKMKEIFNRRQA